MAEMSYLCIGFCPINAVDILYSIQTPSLPVKIKKPL